MKEKTYDYFICGDYNIYGKIEGCLICTCGADKEHAEEVLQKVLSNPPKDCLGNIRIEKEEADDCWWNQGRLD